MQPSRHSRISAARQSGHGRSMPRVSPRTYFHTECAACGRKLYVRVEYLGEHVKCLHCGYHFRAADPNSPNGIATEAESVLARAERLLARQKHTTTADPLPENADAPTAYSFLD